MLADSDKKMACVDTLSEMSGITRAASEPFAPGDSVKVAIDRASRRLGISYRRARSFWNAEPTAVVKASEADKLRAWYWAHVENEAERLEQRAAELRARGNASRERLDGISLAITGKGQFRRG